MNWRPITVRVSFPDACDGVVRLMNDAQRFGLEVRALSVGVEASEAVASLSLLVPETLDLDSLASKFSRHPSFHGTAHIRECTRPAVADDRVGESVR